MRIRTLIATTDTAYTGHISDYISEYHADSLEISVCNTVQQLRKTLSEKRYDVALMDSHLFGQADIASVNLPMLLWANNESVPADIPEDIKRIKKHKRISVTVADVLQRYASVSGGTDISSEAEARITAVWSPIGGIGKTTVALAYAAFLSQSKMPALREVFYLSIEPFASTAAYFNKQGNSISSVLEMLDSKDGNLKMLLQGVRNYENGIWYLNGPDNYDDICILTPDNIRELVAGCAGVCDELVVDLPCSCDEHTRKVFELADKVLLIADYTDTAKTKIAQFTSQCDVYEKIKEKTTLVINRDEAEASDDSKGTFETQAKAIVRLPKIQAANEQSVYMALSKNSFGEQ